MKTVILCYTDQKKLLSNLILKNLSTSYSITVINDTSVKNIGKGEHLLLTEGTKLQNIMVPNAILLFDETFEPDPNLQVDSNSICIASSNNSHLLEKLAQNHARVITCGMSPKDTFTYSSKSETAISIAIQREIYNWEGQSIEPFELVFSLEKAVRSYDLLAFAALLIISGVIKECPKMELPLRQ